MTERSSSNLAQSSGDEGNTFFEKKRFFCLLLNSSCNDLTKESLGRRPARHIFSTILTLKMLLVQRKIGACVHPHHYILSAQCSVFLFLFVRVSVYCVCNARMQWKCGYHHSFSLPPHHHRNINIYIYPKWKGEKFETSNPNEECLLRQKKMVDIWNFEIDKIDFLWRRIFKTYLL